ASSKLAIESGSRVNSVTAQFPLYLGVAASTDTKPATARYFACLSRCPITPPNIRNSSRVASGISRRVLGGIPDRGTCRCHVVVDGLQAAAVERVRHFPRFCLGIPDWQIVNSIKNKNLTKEKFKFTVTIRVAEPNSTVPVHRRRSITAGNHRVLVIAQP
ncbi:MAG: hypothetical protein O3B43_07235, partial [Chloroflexi bacterium]|nr:hypothetical protein [Chloroflexota bacterium]